MLADRPLMILCDLEGVLLNIPGESDRHRDALTRALLTVTGLQAQIPERRDGHTDYTLMAAAVRSLGIEGLLSEEAFALVAEHAARAYAQTCPRDVSLYLRPGVSSTLASSIDDSGLKVVPCSGHLPGIGGLLIERAGLGEDMAVGFASFACYGRTRPDLVQAARERAGGFAGLPWPQDKTVVVSHCAADLAAAQSAGVHTVAVACEDSVAEARIEQFELLASVLAHWR